MTDKTGGPANVLVIVGPTATGKSEAAVNVALKLGGCEIVSADSMQIYRGMDVGTAKPGPGLLSAVPHHLIDIMDPCDDYSVADFQVSARRAIADISARGNLPILVGGSGLYIRAAIDPLDFPAEPIGSPRRAELEELERDDPEALTAILKVVDPEALDHVDLANPRRVIRAIEAVERTGRSFTARREEWLRRRSIYNALLVGLTMPRDRMIEQVENRVDRMVAGGLLEEARRLTTAGKPLSRTAAQALGYKELFAFLRGEEDMAAAVEQIKIRTRQFAKRQMTWFKADPRVNWIDVSGVDPETVADRINALVIEKRFIVS
jgi:tRNA dimethylallyltransferase